jgi:UDP-glucuronate 4-epimerase
MLVLVTGVAGFIGSHVAKALLARGDTVTGIDNVNDYYSVALKRARLAQLEGLPGFTFHEADIGDRDAMAALAGRYGETEGIVHLAAQAGVRYSLENPFAYVHSNMLGQVVMLELARRLGRLRCFVYASSSSVYGSNKKQPFSVDDRVDDPISLYAATKRSCELSTRTYSHLFGLPANGLRFFTVYGPWGRPDMAAYLFADAITAGRPIKVFNEGKMERDFTYIDDIVAGTLAALDRPPAGPVPHKVYNLGNHRPEALTRFIEVLEQTLGRKAVMEMLPMQPGDVPSSFADITSSRAELGFEPRTPIEIGIPKFAAWYKDYVGQQSKV